ncbi:MAG: GIY-YIG nuclease family protein [Bacteroidia bacterium]
MSYYVYILRMRNGKFYVGYTVNINERLKRHEKGQCIYTRSKLPIKLVWYGVFSDRYKAYKFEKYLKSGSGRAFALKRLI